ncbi:hypothetical protein FGIG_07151 [Fasciola gigantica]|uniref:Uncharacterized protein n=1 Tax=Fasciola gigantica TaxID=46835 RepID=A0A504YWX8_FASGI|nr:hypothetical protein FGIG_07151 [Fasciola gigantica]
MRWHGGWWRRRRSIGNMCRKSGRQTRRQLGLGRIRAVSSIQCLGNGKSREFRQSGMVQIVQLPQNTHRLLMLQQFKRNLSLRISGRHEFIRIFSLPLTTGSRLTYHP